jgi:hypothetical protein
MIDLSVQHFATEGVQRDIQGLRDDRNRLIENSCSSDSMKTATATNQVGETVCLRRIVVAMR